MNGDGKSHSKSEKKVKETCPSFSRGHLPSMEDVERLRTLSKPHVDSFDYFLDVGLMRGINDIEPAEMDLVDTGKVREHGLTTVDWSEVSTVQFWIEDIKVAKPVKSGSGKSNLLLPRECRERRIMYSGEMSGKFCYKITQRRNGVKLDGRPVKIPKTFGKLPIMILSKRCHLQGLAPEDLVKVKEEVRLEEASKCCFCSLVTGSSPFRRSSQYRIMNSVVTLLLMELSVVFECCKFKEETTPWRSNDPTTKIAVLLTQTWELLFVALATMETKLALPIPYTTLPQVEPVLNLLQGSRSS
jgi:hypothetical protein